MIGFSCAVPTSGARAWTRAKLFANTTAPLPVAGGEERYCLHTALKTFHIVDFALGSAVNECEALVLIIDCNSEYDFTQQVVQCMQQLQQFYDSTTTTHAEAYLWFHSTSLQNDNLEEEEKFMEAFPSLTILHTLLLRDEEETLFAAWGKVFQSLVPEQINQLCGKNVALIDSSSRIMLAGNGHSKMRSLVSAAIDLAAPELVDGGGWTKILLENGTELQLSQVTSGLWLFITSTNDNPCALVLLHKALVACCDILLPTL